MGIIWGEYMKSGHIILLTAFLVQLHITQADAMNGFSPLAKDRVVVMPVRGSNISADESSVFRAAIVESLQSRYEVLSGSEVDNRIRDIFAKEFREGLDCETEECLIELDRALHAELVKLTESFGAELVATATVVRKDSGYILIVYLNNAARNRVVFARSEPCKGCDEFEIVGRLKRMINDGLVNLENSKPDMVEHAENISKTFKKIFHLGPPAERKSRNFELVLLNAPSEVKIRDVGWYSVVNAPAGYGVGFDINIMEMPVNIHTRYLKADSGGDVVSFYDEKDFLKNLGTNMENLVPDYLYGDYSYTQYSLGVRRYWEFQRFYFTLSGDLSAADVSLTIDKSGYSGSLAGFNLEGGAYWKFSQGGSSIGVFFGYIYLTGDSDIAQANSSNGGMAYIYNW